MRIATTSFISLIPLTFWYHECATRNSQIQQRACQHTKYWMINPLWFLHWRGLFGTCYCVLITERSSHGVSASHWYEPLSALVRCYCCFLPWDNRKPLPLLCLFFIFSHLSLHPLLCRVPKWNLMIAGGLAPRSRRFPFLRITWTNLQKFTNRWETHRKDERLALPTQPQCLQLQHV